MAQVNIVVFSFSLFTGLLAKQKSIWIDTTCYSSIQGAFYHFQLLLILLINLFINNEILLCSTDRKHYSMFFFLLSCIYFCLLPFLTAFSFSFRMKDSGMKDSDYFNIFKVVWVLLIPQFIKHSGLELKYSSVSSFHTLAYSPISVLRLVL